MLGRAPCALHLSTGGLCSLQDRQGSQYEVAEAFTLPESPPFVRQRGELCQARQRFVGEAARTQDQDQAGEKLALVLRVCGASVLACEDGGGIMSGVRAPQGEVLTDCNGAGQPHALHAVVSDQPGRCTLIPTRGAGRGGQAFRAVLPSHPGLRSPSALLPNSPAILATIHISCM